jgi:hypothetical protein
VRLQRQFPAPACVEIARLLGVRTRVRNGPVMDLHLRITAFQLLSWHLAVRCVVAAHLSFSTTWNASVGETSVTAKSLESLT